MADEEQQGPGPEAAESKEQRPGRDQHDAAGHHLERRAEQAGARQRCVARVERSSGPRNCRTQDEQDPDGIEMSEALDRRQQHRDARDPRHQAADDERAGPPAGDDGVEHGEPDRHGRDQHGSDAGRDAQLGKHHPAVAAEQQQRADDEGRADVRAGRTLGGLVG